MKKVILSSILSIIIILSVFVADKTSLYIVKNSPPQQIIQELSTKLGKSVKVDQNNNIIYSIKDIII